MAVAVLGICAAVHPHRGLAIATTVLGAVATSLSGLSGVCNFAGRAALNDDAAMYYSEGQNMAPRRLKSFVCSLNVDPDDVIQACTDVNKYVDPSSSAGQKNHSQRKTGWTFITCTCSQFVSEVGHRCMGVSAQVQCTQK